MKKIITIIVLMICLLINTTRAYAILDVGGGGSSDNTPSSSSSSSSGGGEPTCPSSGSGVYWATSWSVQSTVYADVYDENGKYLGDLLKYETHNFTAGRFVGIDVYEKYVITVSVTANPYCFNYVWDCDHCGGLQCVSYNPEDKREKATRNVMRLAESSGSESAGASSGGSGGSSSSAPQTCQHKCKSGGCTLPTVTRDDIIAELNAVASKYTRNASYKAYRHDVNDINVTDLIPVSSYKETDESDPVVNGLTGTKTITLKIKYNPKQACLNRKTAKVSYINFDSNCNSSSMKIEGFQSIRDENDKVGMYFIPLNTKTNHTYTYELVANAKQIKEVCLDFVNKYQSDQRWRRLLLGSNKQSMANMGYAAAKDAVKKGCYYAMKFEFKVNQEFYNENSSKKIEGYGFFYRPIDVSNPFPNGIGDSTYWGQDNLYNSEENSVTIDNKTYDLDNSFKTVTYKAIVNNPDAIREYNKRADEEGKSYLYMSWDNMKIDGSSGFINGGKYVTRSGEKSFYKLGCGPLNNTWKECDGS